MPVPVTNGNRELPPAIRRNIFVVVLFSIGIALIDLAITQDKGRLWSYLFPITQDQAQVWSYLFPIIPILVFTIGLGLKMRSYGYVFAITYGVTCVAWMVVGSIIGGPTGEVALFVGGAGLAMAASLFLLVWVIFWKLWRVVSSVKDTSGEVRPSELH